MDFVIDSLLVVGSFLAICLVIEAWAEERKSPAAPAPTLATSTQKQAHTQPHAVGSVQCLYPIEPTNHVVVRCVKDLLKESENKNGVK